MTLRFRRECIVLPDFGNCTASPLLTGFVYTAIEQEASVRGNALYGLDAEGKLICCDEEWLNGEAGVTVIRKAAVGTNGLPYGIYEIVLAPHQRSPLPLIPEGSMTTVYITEGTLAIRLNEQTITVSAGSLVQVPEQTIYAAWNPTSNRVRCLAIVADAPRRNHSGKVVSVG